MLPHQGVINGDSGDGDGGKNAHDDEVVRELVTAGFLVAPPLPPADSYVPYSSCPAAPAADAP